MINPSGDCIGNGRSYKLKLRDEADVNKPIMKSIRTGLYQENRYNEEEEKCKSPQHMGLHEDIESQITTHDYGNLQNFLFQAWLENLELSSEVERQCMFINDMLGNLNCRKFKYPKNENSLRETRDVGIDAIEFPLNRKDTNEWCTNIFRIECSDVHHLGDNNFLNKNIYEEIELQTITTRLERYNSQSHRSRCLLDENVICHKLEPNLKLSEKANSKPINKMRVLNQNSLALLKGGVSHSIGQTSSTRDTTVTIKPRDNNNNNTMKQHESNTINPRININQIKGEIPQNPNTNTQSRVNTEDNLESERLVIDLRKEVHSLRVTKRDVEDELSKLLQERKVTNGMYPEKMITQKSERGVSLKVKSELASPITGNNERAIKVRDQLQIENQNVDNKFDVKVCNDRNSREWNTKKKEHESDGMVNENFRDAIDNDIHSTNDKEKIRIQHKIFEDRGGTPIDLKCNINDDILFEGRSDMHQNENNINSHVEEGGINNINNNIIEKESKTRTRTRTHRIGNRKDQSLPYLTPIQEIDTHTPSYREIRNFFNHSKIDTIDSDEVTEVKTNNYFEEREIDQNKNKNKIEDTNTSYISSQESDDSCFSINEEKEKEKEKQFWSSDIRNISDGYQINGVKRESEVPHRKHFLIHSHEDSHSHSDSDVTSKASSLSSNIFSVNRHQPRINNVTSMKEKIKQKKNTRRKSNGWSPDLSSVLDYGTSLLHHVIPDTFRSQNSKDNNYKKSRSRSRRKMNYNNNDKK